eukprot:TRINITY_DN6381_c0_g4_i1.p3 TRINITY_DN6381_c0_g4~~TRINITY_DN6381_c0_g4_i1.p3  ORF type:complete len:124 (+),score=20.44 TRINITY_DN6381_c0_g4_i1:549-920(+)
MIFKIIGTPNTKDLETIQDSVARKYLQSFNQTSPQNLAARFKGSSKQAISVLEQTLQFNPSKRISAEQLLNHEYFNDIKINSELDEDEEQNYSYIHLDFEDQDLNINELRVLINEELLSLIHI